MLKTTVSQEKLAVNFALYHVNMYIRLFYSVSSLFNYIVYFSYCFLFCNILSLLGQTNFPVCGTLKDF